MSNKQISLSSVRYPILLCWVASMLFAYSNTTAQTTVEPAANNLASHRREPDFIIGFLLPSYQRVGQADTPSPGMLDLSLFQSLAFGATVESRWYVSPKLAVGPVLSVSSRRLPAQEYVKGRAITGAVLTAATYRLGGKQFHSFTAGLHTGVTLNSLAGGDKDPRLKGSFAGFLVGPTFGLNAGSIDIQLAGHYEVPQKAGPFTDGWSLSCRFGVVLNPTDFRRNPRQR